MPKAVSVAIGSPVGGAGACPLFTAKPGPIVRFCPPIDNVPRVCVTPAPVAIRPERIVASEPTVTLPLNVDPAFRAGSRIGLVP
jgi:hypothetical protein